MKAVSGKRRATILTGKGWSLSRINGSHHIFVHPDFPDLVSVPIHGDLYSVPDSD